MIKMVTTTLWKGFDKLVVEKQFKVSSMMQYFLVTYLYNPNFSLVQLPITKRGVGRPRVWFGNIFFFSTNFTKP